MNYKVYFGTDKSRKEYVLAQLVKRTDFQTTDTAVPLLNLLDDERIENLYYDGDTNTITYYGIQFSNKELEELSPRKFVDKMNEKNPKKIAEDPIVNGHYYKGKCSDLEGAYEGLLYAFNEFFYTNAGYPYLFSEAEEWEDITDEIRSILDREE